ncbi:hypothetical protein M3N55_11750 [Roseibaca sp. V10]|uniref:Uncharacterized protein n=1 Tax=Roseinatronobacter domitianus TaxID=2940293 RepID=A0ABT0M3G9_9RHOB|nr:hypothetical protein [Roseibaca domitiana]MCL1629407.1 hypothetical protein [Roseibaca domitiana]
MTPKQMIDFDARRESVLRAHLKQNPKYRATVRDRRVAFAAGVVRYFVGLGVVLFLLKTFLISQNGQDAYLAMVAPLLEHVSVDGVLAQAVAPDRYSTFLASAIADMTAPKPQTAASVPEALDRVIPGVSGS